MVKTFRELCTTVLLTNFGVIVKSKYIRILNKLQILRQLAYCLGIMIKFLVMLNLLPLL